MYNSEWADDLDDEEYPDEWDDADADDIDVDVVPCPHCGAEIYEESEQCPICKQYVAHSTMNVAWRWRLTVVIVLACLAYFLWTALTEMW